MRVQVVANCQPRCGVRVEGEVETSSREFIHRFTFPAGAGVAAPPTEVEETHLATFAPDSKHWFVECPLCGAPIHIDVVFSPGA